MRKPDKHLAKIGYVIAKVPKQHEQLEEKGKKTQFEVHLKGQPVPNQLSCRGSHLLLEVPGVRRLRNLSVVITGDASWAAPVFALPQVSHMWSASDGVIVALFPSVMLAMTRLCPRQCYHVICVGQHPAERIRKARCVRMEGIVGDGLTRVMELSPEAVYIRTSTSISNF